ncbi:MAG: hypothetical protein KDB53_09220, partial [Planctomycetes bacterium]|nr:hypothetical protein [Planctomycetota bacterium]
LIASLPVLGQVMTINGQNAQPSVVGDLVAGFPINGIPFNVMGPAFNQAATLYFVPSQASSIGPIFAGPQGDWGLSGPVPSNPAAAGVQFNFQGVFYSPANGLTLTDAVRITIGV